MPPTRAHLQTIASFVSKDTQYDPFMYASPNVEDFKLTTPIRMQGFLKKRGRSKAGWKTWFTRWFVLDRCSLVYYESQAAFMAGKHPQAVMPLDDRFEIHPEPTDASGIKKSCLDRVFEIVASPTFDKALSGKTEQVLVVKARTLQLRGDWFEALQTAYCITRITGSICGPELPRFLRTSTTNQMADSALDHAVSLTDSVQDGSDDNTERDEDKYSDDNMYPPQLSEDGDEIPPPPVWTPKSERHHLEMQEVQKVMDQLADSVSRVLTPPLLSRVTQLAKSNESPPTEWGTLQSSAKLRQSSIPKAQWQSIQPSAMKPVSRFPMSPERNMKETIAAYDGNMGPKSARYARDAIGLASPSYPRDRPVAKPASHNSKPTMYSISPAVKPHRQVTFQLSPKPSAPTSFARSQTFSESVSSPRHSPRSETRAPRSALKPTRSADYFSPRLGQEYAPSRGLTSFEAAESSASLSHLKSSNGLIVTYTKDAPARMQNRDRERDRETSNRKGVALRMDYLKSISVDSMHSWGRLRSLVREICFDIDGRW